LPCSEKEEGKVIRRQENAPRKAASECRVQLSFFLPVCGFLHAAKLQNSKEAVARLLFWGI